MYPKRCPFWVHPLITWLCLTPSVSISNKEKTSLNFVTKFQSKSEFATGSPTPTKTHVVMEYSPPVFALMGLPLGKLKIIFKLFPIFVLLCPRRGRRPCAGAGAPTCSCPGGNTFVPNRQNIRNTVQGLLQG